MSRWTLFLAVCLAMGACASVKPQTPAQAVYEVEGAYIAALHVSVDYAALPRCPATPLCSKLEIIAQADQAAQVAWSVLQGAQATVTTPGVNDSAVTAAAASAQAAVNAFVAITNTLQVK